MAADVVSNEIGEPAFRSFAEQLVVVRLLADHEMSAVVTGVEPLGGRNRRSTGAVEVHTGTQFNERAPLRKVCRFFVLDAHQSRALMVSKDADSTD